VGALTDAEADTTGGVALIAAAAYLLAGSIAQARCSMTSVPLRGKRGPTAKKRQPIQPAAAAAKSAGASRLAAEQKLVLRDIWVYAGGLFAVTAVVGLLISNFELLILAPAAAVCVVGALLLHLATIERFARARRSGTAPSTTRIFG
jgi:hypothetical protein